MLLQFKNVDSGKCTKNKGFSRFWRSNLYTFLALFRAVFQAGLPMRFFARKWAIFQLRGPGIFMYFRALLTHVFSPVEGIGWRIKGSSSECSYFYCTIFVVCY